MDIKQWIDDNQALFTNINDEIWGYAETFFEEYKSAELLAQTLENAGFRVSRAVADMPSAFVAEFGSGKPIIGILGEYDALPALSQKADVFKRDPIQENGPGHGCGHHALGAGALAAAMAVQAYLKETGDSGTVRYYGCPGEEHGSGKGYMARAGLYNDLDAALTWHPGSVNKATTMSSLAVVQMYYRFHGRAAHAAAVPHLGRSALDAVELMNVGANYLREHLVPEARLHYAVLNTGGTAPNVVQAEAEVTYMLRAPELGYVRDMMTRVEDIAKGAALMTGTTLDIVFDEGCSNLIPNHTLDHLLHETLEEVVAEATYTTEEDALAKKIQATFAEKDTRLKALLPYVQGNEKDKIRTIMDQPICQEVVPYVVLEDPSPGSTDVGDTSWVVPTAQVNTATWVNGTPGHSWQTVTQGKNSICHKGMLMAGKTLALATIKLLHSPETLTAAKTEHQERLNGEVYQCPIPADLKPSIYR